MNVQAISVRNYTKRNEKTGAVNPVFVYAVGGTKAAQDHYAAAVKLQKDQNTGLPIEPRYEDDDATKRPLFFTTRYSGETITIGFKQDGTPFLDNSEMQKLSSLVDQAGTGVLGQAMANLAAAKILGIGQMAPAAIQQAAAPISTPAETEVEASGANPDAL